MKTATVLCSEPPLHDWVREAREAWELALEREAEAILDASRASFSDFLNLMEEAFYFDRSDAQEQLDRALWRFWQGDHRPMADLLPERLVRTAYELAREKLGDPS